MATDCNFIRYLSQKNFEDIIEAVLDIQQNKTPTNALQLELHNAYQRIVINSSPMLMIIPVSSPMTLNSEYDDNTSVTSFTSETTSPVLLTPTFVSNIQETDQIQEKYCIEISKSASSDHTSNETNDENETNDDQKEIDPELVQLRKTILCGFNRYGRCKFQENCRYNHSMCNDEECNKNRKPDCLKGHNA